METIVSTLIYILIFLSALSYYLSKKQERKHKAKQQQQQPKLPPGSMGWPVIGETLQLYSQDPNVFFAKKQKRYGDVFKTNILGCPCIMLASPEAARFVLVTHSHLFKPTYPKSKEIMIGPWALFFHEGRYHTNLRKLVHSSLSPDVLRKLVPDIEAVVISRIEAMASGSAINTFHEMKKLSFEVGILTIFGRLESKHKDELKKNYLIVDKGYNSFPTNLPGTAYRRALKARKRLNEIIREIIKERREKKVMDKDLLGHLLNFKDERNQTLTEDQIADNIIGVLFAAQDTTASVLTWILKYLHDDPKLLESVKMEQKAIYDSNGEGKLPLTWAQTRNMPVTHKVILESLRMASIISFTFREAVVDVEYDGFLIPKGWKVMPLFRIIHHNPEYFMDPKSFDPSRFEVAPKPNTFMPFGGGAHACPGNELAKLEMLIMIHHLVTKYRWEVIGSKNDVQYSPFPVPRDGLPAKFYKNPASP
ncbi:OLC1v1000109C1 [Oldenlandia corymbosa var. corymbosa]|uniref:(+)-abscisic acid 8'-hydroxylase n=1 Tax=Oldenlandia corymbosa var. corymbosa TaxID=529605 RepID=A0AAV1D482_OLDCO|nr:OLC1v1000109C1 [Oldenlandia corymbosa var. corymbosa]